MSEKNHGVAVIMVVNDIHIDHAVGDLFPIAVVMAIFHFVPLIHCAQGETVALGCARDIQSQHGEIWYSAWMECGLGLSF